MPFRRSSIHLAAETARYGFLTRKARRSVSLVVLLILAAVWGVFLVPQVLRARADRGPADSIGSFRNQLSMIEQSLPNGAGRARVSPLAARRAQQVPLPSYAASLPIGAPVRATAGVLPPTRSQLQKRRRDVLLGLLAAVVGTLAIGLLFRPALLLNVVADIAFAGYVALLVRARTIAAEREMKVRYMHRTSPAPMRMPSAEHALRTAAR